MLGYGLGVGHVAVHARAQRFDALNQKEGVEGADARAEIAHAFHAGANDEGEVAEDLEEIHAVIGGRGRGEHGEMALAPIEARAA